LQEIADHALMHYPAVNGLIALLRAERYT